MVSKSVACHHAIRGEVQDQEDGALYHDITRAPSARSDIEKETYKVRHGSM